MKIKSVEKDLKKSKLNIKEKDVDVKKSKQKKEVEELAKKRIGKRP